ncbi:MAG: polyprenol monophosphomannose synthase [Deltaproteobacteria bacterium]|nr:polyprenol monophosphomannose synthase [Deltaproteobacteria bacterium]
MTKNLVIIPTYNEKENIRNITKAVFEKIDTHILIVDDNSPDGTGKIADELAEENEYKGRLFVLHRSKKEGLGKAYVAGFKWALERDYEHIFEMDADFSHNPDYLPLFLEKIKEYDLVIGSRYVKGGGVQNWSFLRMLISKGGSLYSRMILGIPIKDLTGGYKCFRRIVLESIDLDNLLLSGFGFQIEMNYRAYKKGFRVYELPIIFTDRLLGKSKMSQKIFFEALLLVIKLRLKVRETPISLPPAGSSASDKPR